MHPERDLQTDPQQALRAAITEYEAARRRVERDAARVAEETRTRLIEQLLPILDDVDRTIAATREAATIEGVRLVRARLEKVLAGFGVERFDSIGERFDPRLHEAMGVVDVADRALDGVVVDQWQAGYRVGERLLRAARVQVGCFHPVH